MRPPSLPCGEQGKLPSAKELTLAERDKHMSDEKQPSFRSEELDDWVEAEIFEPMAEGATPEFRREFLPQIQSAIRDKAELIYEDGYNAGLKAAEKRQEGGRA